MRLIGHLAEKASALTFSDFLYVQGIGNDLEPEKDGWAIWVHGEDEVPRAKEFLDQFKTNPTDPKYQNRASEASQLKQMEELQEAKAKKRHFDRSQVFQDVRPYRVGPLTFGLIATCIAMALFTHLGENHEVLNNFRITESGHFPALPEITNGQVWRLLTPIFLHFGWPHLIFNMLAILDLGSMIEARASSGRLLLLVVVIGIVSNLGQYAFEISRLSHGSSHFGGMSGVAYGLLGYIWMKSQFDPGSGFFLHRQAVVMMLIWFVLCLIGVLGNIANTAHAVGLILGVVWGYLSSIGRRR
jgi:GlpG protein